MRLRLRHRSAQLKRDRQRARCVTAGDGKHGIGETGVEGAVDLHIQRPIGRKGRGAGQAQGGASPGVDCRVKRCSASRELAGAGDVERGQAEVAHLRCAHTLQTHPPFAGRTGWCSADRRLAVGDAG